MDFYEIRQKEEKFFVDYFATIGLYKKADLNKTSTPKLYEKYIKQLFIRIKIENINKCSIAKMALYRYNKLVT